DQLGMPSCFETIAKLRGSPILPDDCVVDRLARLAIPNHGRLALIRDADAGYVAGGKVGLCEDGTSRLELGLPDFVGIVLDPARLREDLSKLLLRDGANRTVV